MEIKLNNRKEILTEESSLQHLLNSFMPQSQKGVAIAVNQSVIPRSNWEKHFLNPHDEVLIIKATQGG